MSAPDRDREDRNASYTSATTTSTVSAPAAAAAPAVTPATVAPVSASKGELTWRNGFKRREIPKITSLRFDPPYWAFPPPPSMQDMRLDLHEEDGSRSQSVNIHAALTADRVFTVGRSQFENAPALVILGGSESASRFQLMFIYTREGLMVFDPFSSHGNTLNGKPLRPGFGEPVFDGDRLCFLRTPPPPAEDGTPRRQRYLTVAGTGITRAAGEEALLKAARAAGASAAGAGAHAGTVRARHILLKHALSRHPVCWKAPTPVTRTAAEAKAGTEALRRKIVDGKENFEYLATLESECSSHKRGGDLGPFTYEKMEPPFSKAAFALAVGEVSQPVETRSGWHIILRLA